VALLAADLLLLGASMSDRTFAILAFAASCVLNVIAMQMLGSVLAFLAVAITVLAILLAYHAGTAFYSSLGE
jgi:hypothetical protein